jgi:hypothetical protein
VPISKDEFRSLGEDGPSLPDLAPDTTQGAVYRFLFGHADQAFRQGEIVDAVDVPEESVARALNCLEEHGLVEHRDRFWTISDAEHATTSAGVHGAATANDIDDGFSDGDIAAWMETAVDPIGYEIDSDDKES